MLDAFAQARHSLMTDPHRPQIHLAPPANWMNDPNGLIQWRGRSHVFYQYNPNGPLWGTIHWGHAVSDDLLHWEDLPLALAPEPGGADADGCFSGCTVEVDGLATAIYTGIVGHQEYPCRATSRDADLAIWEKDPDNPVIAGPPPGLDLLGFRDHSIWRQGDGWRMVIGSGIRGVGGTALMYASDDLCSWTYLHPLCIGDPATTGTMWECPDFFPLGDRHVLIISPIPLGMAFALIGHYDGERFTPETVQPLDGSRSFYAPQSFRDGQGRRILIGWLKELRPDEALVQAGWAGMMALPRILTLGPDQRLRMTPITEVDALIASGQTPTKMIVPAMLSSTLLTPIAHGNHCAADLTCVLGDGPLWLELHADGGSLACIQIDRVARSMAIAATRAALADAPPVPLHLVQGDILRLRVFVDGSAIEVFANDLACVTWRYYPRAAASVQLAIAGDGARLLSGKTCALT